MSALLALTALACERGGRRLFSDVSLELGAGELLRVEGANGAGKTSLLRMLCGLMEPAAGQVLWRGQKVTSLREEFGRELIYLGHAAALKDELSPLENLQVACTLAAQPGTAQGARQALAAAGLRGLEHTPVRRLSQGQRKRSALARLALAQASGQGAALWILDEPFNALDDQAAAWLVGLVSKQLQQGGLVVLTSHQSVALNGTPQQVLAL